MRKLIWAINVLVLTTALVSCSSLFKKIEIKLYPEYVGVDARVKPIVDEFFELSARNNIVFKNRVTVGIKKVNRKSVIGLCTRSLSWREIDIDETFLAESSSKRAKILVFHELVHCYCSRGHDFEGKKYSEGIEKVLENWREGIAASIPWCLEKLGHGFLEDGCSASIMNPYIVSDECAKAHYEEYLKEMLNDCVPY